MYKLSWGGWVKTVLVFVWCVFLSWTTHTAQWAWPAAVEGMGGEANMTRGVKEGSRHFRREGAAPRARHLNIKGNNKRYNGRYDSLSDNGLPNIASVASTEGVWLRPSQLPALELY